MDGEKEEGGTVDEKTLQGSERAGDGGKAVLGPVRMVTMVVLQRRG